MYAVTFRFFFYFSV
ncbi:pheST operon leader peptide PheM [Yersinia kristensenii]